jgi:hypothetical protein
VTATMTATQATYTGGPPLAEVAARCAALNDAAELLADLLADDPQVLLMLIQAHLLRAQKTHRL